MKGTLSGLPFHCRRPRRRAGALDKNVRPTRYFGSAGSRFKEHIRGLINCSFLDHSMVYNLTSELLSYGQSADFILYSSGLVG